MYVSSYKDLILWQKSISLVEEIYLLTENFPQNENYGLISQMRRAAVSIPSNIAEGYRRNSRAEYIQFLYISFGSASELETQLIICERLNKLDKFNYVKVNGLLIEIIKLLSTYIQNLKVLPKR